MSGIENTHDMMKLHTSDQPEPTITTEQLKEFAEKILQLRIVINRIQQAKITSKGSFIAFIEFGAYGDADKFLTALNTLLTTEFKNRDFKTSENIIHDLNYNQTYLLLTEKGLNSLTIIFHTANEQNLKLVPPSKETSSQPVPSAQTNQTPPMPAKNTCTIQ